MSKRINVGLRPDSDLEALKRALLSAGAEAASGPAPSLPDVIVATLPDGANEAEFIAHVSTLAGVRYAEADAWAGTGPLLK